MFILSQVKILGSLASFVQRKEREVMEGRETKIFDAVGSGQFISIPSMEEKHFVEMFTTTRQFKISGVISISCDKYSLLRWNPSPGGVHFSQS